MKQSEIDKIVEDHGKWLCGSADGRRANLRSADLYGADLYGANLYGADLYGANLRGADLSSADLRGADLYGADLYGANLRGANLRSANLRGANLRSANLSGANLSDADLSDADLSHAIVPPSPVVADLDAQILAAIDANPNALEMGAWHTCETTHCRAGWAVVLAGEEGRKMESEFGTAVAGALIYYASTGRVPDFYAENEEAIEDMRASCQTPKGVSA